MNDILDEHRSHNVYFDRRFGLQAAKLLPGEYFAAARPMLLVTVLGSCVAACIRDPALGVGGMNHFMLPGRGSVDDPLGVPARYGVHAMELLINRLMHLGARRDRMEAKVFGGGSVLRAFTHNSVGERNADFVRAFLRAENIRVAASDLLGVHARKLYYFPATGRALVKTLAVLHNETLLERERDYGARLARETGGDVELFG